MATRKEHRNAGSRVDSDPLLLTIQGYKSIMRRTTLAIKPLTVLSGTNSSGKSSFMQPLLLMKQTLEAPFDPGPLMINGPNIRFTSASQFLAATENGHVKDVYIGLEHAGIGSELHFHKADDKAIELKSQRTSQSGSEVLMAPGRPMDFNTLPPFFKDYLKPYGDMATARPLIAIRNRCFLDVGMQFGNDRSQTVVLGVPRHAGEFPQVLGTMLHLPGLRGNPSRTYQISAVSDTFPGPFQNYAASLINHWGERDSRELVTLNTYLRELQIATRISTKKVDETQVELRVDRLGVTGGSSVSIADVGMAVSQMLPVLVALAAAKAGQLIFIEQPELHLHPKAQFALARIICGAVERGVRLVIETHSSLLLLGIQTCIAEKIIEHSNVALHWFRRDPEGITCVESAELDETGAFGEWPQDFADVSLEAEDKYLTAAEGALHR